MKMNMRLFERKNGYWYYEVVRHHPRSLKTKDARMARKLYKIIKQEYLEGRLVQLDNSKRITLNEFKKIFFEELDDVTSYTIDAYDLAIRQLIDFFGGSTLISRIDKKKLKKFRKNCKTRGVRKTSINTYLRHIRTYLNIALKKGFIEKKVEIPFYVLGKRHPRVLRGKEVAKLMRYAYRHNRPMYYWIKFALWTGCRRHEVWTLRWENVHGDDCTVIGKGDKERTIALLPMAKSAMGEPKDIGYVFIHYADIDRHTKEFKKLVRDCGLPSDKYDITLHKLRHTAATNMLANGVRLEVVQDLLGHADISTTRIYADILGETVKRELNEKVKGFML